MNGEAEVITFKRGRRISLHIPHLHKYLRALLPEEKRFYFQANGFYDGPCVASSLWEFRVVLDEEVLRVEELAWRIRKITRRPGEGEALRRAPVATVADRYDELECLI